MNDFSRCLRFRALEFVILHQFFKDFRSFVLDVFSMDFDMIFGLLFDVSCTSLEENANFENMCFDAQITMFREGRGILEIFDCT